MFDMAFNELTGDLMIHIPRNQPTNTNSDYANISNKSQDGIGFLQYLNQHGNIHKPVSFFNLFSYKRDHMEVKRVAAAIAVANRAEF